MPITPLLYQENQCHFHHDYCYHTCYLWCLLSLSDTTPSIAIFTRTINLVHLVAKTQTMIVFTKLKMLKYPFPFLQLQKIPHHNKRYPSKCWGWKQRINHSWRGTLSGIGKFQKDSSNKAIKEGDINAKSAVGARARI